MDLHLFTTAAYSWLACASIMTVVVVILGYLYTHIKRSKQSTKIAAPSPGTPKPAAASIDLKEDDNDKDTVTDDEIEDTTDTEDATTEDVSKEEFSGRKWPIDCPMSENFTKSVQDPVTFCEHIQSEVKKAEQKFATKKLQEEMSAEQIAEERVIQQQQLSAIFKMMEDDSDKFGISSLGDMTDQMKLYM